jgi:hypothetical protein
MKEQSVVDTSAVPNWPVVHIALGGDGTLRVDGEDVVLEPGADSRTSALNHAAEMARQLGRAVRVDAQEPDGTVFRLIVDENGEVDEAGPAVLPPTSRRRTSGRWRDKIGNFRHRTASSPSSAVDQHVPPPVGASTDLARMPDGDADHLPAIPPVPTPEQATILARVRDLAEAGDLRLALMLLAPLEEVATGPEAAALREVRAYVTFMDGRPEQAARLYAQTALDLFRDEASRSGPAEHWARSMLGCAHHCWLNINELEEAFMVGKEVVACYEALGLAASPDARSARRLQKATKVRLRTSTVASSD